MAEVSAMKTEDLISQFTAEITAEAAQPRWPLSARLMAALAASGAFVLALLLLLFAPNPHLAHGITPSVAFTLASTASLVGAAFVVSVLLSRPDANFRFVFAWLPATAILTIGIAYELFRFPHEAWLGRAVGSNPLACFVSVFALSIPILAAAFWVLRQGASMRPRLSGAIAGLLAGGLTTALYVVHCPEDSLLYTTAWHLPAILLVVGLGGVLGRRLLRW
jgi:hypothetical protein